MKKNNQPRPSEKTYPLESVNAYIFIRSQGGDLARFLENVKQLKQVKSTAIVAGDYDAVMRVSVQNLEQLMDVTDEIQRMHGIQQTSTHVIQKEVFPY
jgi:DNA-binding Lrp family transcriptional regulator